MRRAIGLLLAAAATLGLAPAVAGSSACPGPDAQVVGVVYDSASRYDFQQDVDNFEAFVRVLGETYCLPRARVEILAFDARYSRAGFTYDTGSEANFKAALATAGARATADPSMTTFVFLSSHGNLYAGEACGGVGSFAALKAGGGEDGLLRDCELGNTLAARFPPGAPMVIAIDCSFCGGFSDSITAASGTMRDDALTRPSGIPAPGRIVITGCAITTECFGGTDGGITFGHLKRVLDPAVCDGFTAPGFPDVQGVNAPVRTLARDGSCSASEWFFAAVDRAVRVRDAIGIQQQFRIKYGYARLTQDIAVS